MFLQGRVQSTWAEYAAAEPLHAIRTEQPSTRTVKAMIPATQGEPWSTSTRTGDTIIRCGFREGEAGGEMPKAHRTAQPSLLYGRDEPRMSKAQNPCPVWPGRGVHFRLSLSSAGCRRSHRDCHRGYHHGLPAA